MAEIAHTIPALAFEPDIAHLASAATVADIVMDAAMFGRTVIGDSIQITMSRDQESALLLAISGLTDGARKLRDRLYEAS